jgi:hypothetical protein
MNEEELNVLPANASKLTKQELQNLVLGRFEIVRLKAETCKRLGVPPTAVAVVKQGKRYNAVRNIAVSAAAKKNYFGHIVVCSRELVLEML